MRGERWETPRVPLCICHPDLALGVMLWRSRHLAVRLGPDCCGCCLSESTAGPRGRGQDVQGRRELVPRAHDVDVWTQLLEFFKGRGVLRYTRACLTAGETPTSSSSLMPRLYWAFHGYCCVFMAAEADLQSILFRHVLTAKPFIAIKHNQVNISCHLS